MNIGDRLLEAWESMEVINYRNCKLAHKSQPTTYLARKWPISLNTDCLSSNVIA